MNTVRCPTCGWDFQTNAPAGITIGCEGCQAEFEVAYPTATHTPTLDIRRPEAAPPRVEVPVPVPVPEPLPVPEPEPQSPPPVPQTAPLTSATFQMPLRSSVRMAPALPPFPLELSLTFNYVLMAGANGTCSFTLRNNSAQTVSRVQLKLECDAFKGGTLLIDHDPLAPGEVITDPLDLGTLDPRVHGPVIVCCTVRAGTPEGIRYAEGKLQNEDVVILPTTASSKDISVKVGDNFALGNRGNVNINVGGQEELHELLKRRKNDAPAHPVPLRPRGAVEAAGLPHHHTNSLDMEFLRVSTGSRAVWFCQHITTQAQWLEVTGTTQEQQLAKKGSEPCGLHPMMPVYGVNLAEAQDFCRRLNDMEAETGLLPPGYIYRLPTESEWRTACGSAQMTDRELKHCAWTMLASVQGPQIVGKLKPNESGLYDMRGNVFEWCSPENSPLGKAPILGGSWYAEKQGADLDAARNGSRIQCSVETRSSRIGFRVVLAPRV